VGYSTSPDSQTYLYDNTTLPAAPLSSTNGSRYATYTTRSAVRSPASTAAAPT
jgi:hypothetical protein